jgi:hypothetical protein
MLNLEQGVLLWLLVWSFIGSSLGFFTVRNSPLWSYKQKILEYFKSVFVGIFFAFPLFGILEEKNVFNTDLNIMLSGCFAFGITDLIIKSWSRIIDVINKSLDRMARKCTSIGKD